MKGIRNIDMSKLSNVFLTDFLSEFRFDFFLIENVEVIFLNNFPVTESD